MHILQHPSSLHWTLHAKAKMHFYGISEQRVKRILHTPKRVEEGIAPDTIAVMQPAGSLKHPYELWVMAAQNSKMGHATRDMETAQDRSKKTLSANRKRGIMRIISVWRYPGTTKPGSEISLKMLTDVYAECADKE